MFDEDGKKCLVFELMRGGELLDKILRQKFFRDTPINQSINQSFEANEGVDKYKRFRVLKGLF